MTSDVTREKLKAAKRRRDEREAKLNQVLKGWSWIEFELEEEGQERTEGESGRQVEAELNNGA